MLVAQSCLTLCNPMDCILPGSSVHGILQARRIAISFSRGAIIRALIPSMKAPPSRPNHLLKTPPPNTTKFDNRFQPVNFVGTQTFSPYHQETWALEVVRHGHGKWNRGHLWRARKSLKEVWTDGAWSESKGIMKDWTGGARRFWSRLSKTILSAACMKYHAQIPPPGG